MLLVWAREMAQPVKTIAAILMTWVRFPGLEINIRGFFFNAISQNILQEGSMVAHLPPKCPLRTLRSLNVLCVCMWLCVPEYRCRWRLEPLGSLELEFQVVVNPGHGC